MAGRTIRVAVVCSLAAFLHLNIAHQTPAEEPSSSRVDRWGDSLPPHAIARLGSTRLRHPGGISAIMFLPDGGSIIASGYNGSFYFWDVGTGKLTRTIPTGSDRVRAFAIANEKEFVAGVFRGEIVVYDIRSGKAGVRFKAHEESIDRIGMSSDKKCLVTTDYKQLKIWDWPSAGKMRVSIDLQHNVNGLTFSADGKQLITVDDVALTFRDVLSGKIVKEVGQPRGHSVAISPNGDMVACGNSRGLVSFWDKGGDKKLRELRHSKGEEPSSGHDEIRSLCFSPDNLTLAVASHRGLSLWATDTGKEIARVAEPLATPWDVLFSPNGKLIATVNVRGEVRFWDARTLGETTRQFGHTGGIRSLAVSPTGKAVATGGYDASIRIWDPISGKCLSELAEHRDGVWSLAFSANGRWLASGDWSGGLCCWETRDWKMPGRLVGHKTDVNEVFFLCDNDALFLMDNKDHAYYWDPGSRKQLRDIRVPFARPTSVQRSSTGQILAFLYDEGTVFVDAATGKTVSTTRLRVRGSRGAFYSDDSLFVQGSLDREIITIWDYKKEKRIRSFEIPLPDRLLCLALSPDDRFLALGYVGGALRIVHMATGQVCHEFRGHAKDVNRIAYFPDGSAIVTASDDSTALVWDVAGRYDHHRPERLTVFEMTRSLYQLSDDDPATAFHAIWQLVDYPDDTFSLLKTRLRPVSRVESFLVRRLIRDLDDDSFEHREKASSELLALGWGIEPELREQLRQPNISEEVRSRISRILERFARSPEHRWVENALIVLEYMHTPNACALLSLLAGGAEGSWVTAEASHSLRRATRASKASNSSSLGS